MPRCTTYIGGRRISGGSGGSGGLAMRMTAMPDLQEKVFGK